LLATVKMRVLAGEAEETAADARWALDQGPARAQSPIGRYAAVLALLALGDDEGALPLTQTLRDEPEERFPRAVADALAGLAARDATAYESGLTRTLRSFEDRQAYLEGVPVADTVLMLEALAAPRALAAHPSSSLLPGAAPPSTERSS
jgi:hypothetical protein